MKLYKWIPICMAFLLVGCGKEEAKELDNTIICSDFVSYDITRQIAEGSGIAVEGIDFNSIDWERGLSGRDKNRINKSRLFVNGTWIDESKIGLEENTNRITLASFAERKKNDKDKNKLYSGISLSKEENKDEKDEGNKQVIVNPNANKTDKDKDTDKDKNTDKDKDSNKGSADTDKDNEAANTDKPDNTGDSGNENSDDQNAGSENNDSSENSETDKPDLDKDGYRLYFLVSSYGAPPVGSDRNGKSLGNFEPGYVISGTQNNPDEYWLWLCDRMDSLQSQKLSSYIILDNENGTYTIFRDITALTPKYEVVASIEDIPIRESFRYREIICESSTRPMLDAYSDCFMDVAKASVKTAMADTVDFAEGFWLDVKNARAFAKEVKNKLIEIDPENTELYESNYEKVDSDLAALDDKFQLAVDSSTNHLLFIGGQFVYGYMTESYGIDYVSIYDYANDETVTPTRLLNYANILDEYKIKYIVKDKESAMDGINNVKAEISHNLNTLIIDTLKTVDDWENSSYLDLMNSNHTILKKALY